MDETKNRYITAGIVVGAVTVGLVVLARKTPPDQWGETLRRIASDALDLVRARYGASEPVAVVEKTLEKFHETGRETTLSQAFEEALSRTQGNGK